MKILVDADVPERICPDLRAAGHDAVHATEIGLPGGDNQALIARAREEHRTILSRNTDLELHVLTETDIGPSLVLIRYDSTPSEDLASRVLGALTPVSQDILSAGAIAEIHPESTTIRRLGH